MPIGNGMPIGILQNGIYERYYERWRLYLKRYDIPLSRSSALHIGILQNGITNGDGYILNDMIYRLAYSRSSVLHIGIVQNGIRTVTAISSTV